MNRIYKVLQYLKYYRKAKTIHSIHSPFLYKLLDCAIEDSRHYYAFEAIEMERKQLLNDHRVIVDKELGAGSNGSHARQIEVSHIAEKSLSSPDQARILFRIIHWLQPARILELGTSLGISTLYMYNACKKAEIITVEGSAPIAQRARSLFNKHNAQVQLIAKTFEEVINQIKKSDMHFDLIYLDGNHQFDSTISYVKEMIPYIKEPGVIILDDINWSPGMTKAWMNLIELPNIDASIDLYYKGMLIVNRELGEKQRHVIIERKWKPWSFSF